jgi:hypothetical protein
MGKKNRTFISYLDNILMQGEYKNIAKNKKKGLRTVRHTVKKNLHVFANISATGCDILKILTDLDLAGHL